MENVTYPPSGHPTLQRYQFQSCLCWTDVDYREFEAIRGLEGGQGGIGGLLPFCVSPLLL